MLHIKPLIKKLIISSSLLLFLCDFLVNAQSSASVAKPVNTEWLQKVCKFGPVSKSALANHGRYSFKAQIGVLDRKISLDLENGQKELALEKIRRRELYRSFASNVMDVSHQHRKGIAACRATIDQYVKDLVQRVEMKSQEPLAVILQLIRDKSFLPHPEMIGPVNAYFYGLPSSEMSSFVHRIGNSLNLYVCEINLSNLNPPDLLGPDQLDEWVSMPDSRVLGKIGECLKNTTHSNFIIFFNETDSVLSEIQNLPSKDSDYRLAKKIKLQEKLTHILEERRLDLNGLGISFPRDRITILLGGDAPVTNRNFIYTLPQINVRAARL